MRDLKMRIKVLSEKHNYDKTEAGKIWGFGPFGEGANMLFDIT
jgi:elongation factor 2